jgi:hypothetical protein
MIVDIALVNSGATENFIDWRTTQRWEVGTVKLSLPRLMYNVDGTQNQSGTLIEYCTLRCLIGKKESLQRFYIINLGQDCVLLGYPWLSEFNPQIDWTKGEVDGGKVHIETKWKKFQRPRQSYRRREVEPVRIDYTDYTKINWVNIAQEWVIKAHQEWLKEKKIPEELPPQYKDYKDVFDEEKSHCFPPSRPEDHAI